MLADALEHLVRGIVEHPDDVKVRVRQQRYRETLQVRVHPEDLGRVIGRSGRTAKSIRTVMDAISDGSQVRIDIVDTDKKPLRRIPSPFTVAGFLRAALNFWVRDTFRKVSNVK